MKAPCAAAIVDGPCKQTSVVASSGKQKSKHARMIVPLTEAEVAAKLKKIMADDGNLSCVDILRRQVQNLASSGQLHLLDEHFELSTEEKQLLQDALK